MKKSVEGHENSNLKTRIAQWLIMRFVQTPQTHFCLLFLKSMNGLGLETPQEPELHANCLISRSMHSEEREDINVGHEFGS